jgi:hypothetical protein
MRKAPLPGKVKHHKKAEKTRVNRYYDLGKAGAICDDV